AWATIAGSCDRLGPQAARARGRGCCGAPYGIRIAGGRHGRCNAKRLRPPRRDVRGESTGRSSMIVALLVALLAVWITWVLFRDDDSAEKVANTTGAEQADDRGRRADE